MSISQDEINQFLRDNGHLKGEDVSFLGVTYNAAGKDPDEEKLDSLFEAMDHYTMLPDMVCVSLQEMVDLTATNVMADAVGVTTLTTERESKWFDLIVNLLNRTADRVLTNESKQEGTYRSSLQVELYVPIAVECMLGLFIFLLGKKPIKKMIRNVNIGQCPQGLGGFRNKGAVSIRFDLLDCTMCIVNSHFTAHRGNVEKRNADYHAILRAAMFPDENKEIEKYLDKPMIGGAMLKHRQDLQKLIKRLEKVPISRKKCVLTPENSKEIKSKLHKLKGNPHVVKEPHTGDDTSAISGDASETDSDTAVDTDNNGEWVEYGSDSAKTLSEKVSYMSMLEKGVRDSINRVRKLSTDLTGGAVTSMNATDEEEEESNPFADSSEAPPDDTSHVVEEGEVVSFKDDNSEKGEEIYDAEELDNFYLKIPTLLDEDEQEHYLCPDEHDILIWMGDLNYRLSKDISDSDVFEMINQDRYFDLANYDQLSIEKDAGRCFQDFNEGLKNFKPTYKFIPGTKEYDYHENGKQRCPAWCDRILWRTREYTTLEKNVSVYSKNGKEKRTNPEDYTVDPIFTNKREGRRYTDYSSNGLRCNDITTIQLMAYEHCRKVLMSDHFPVYCLLHMKVKKVDWTARESYLMALHRDHALQHINVKQITHVSGHDAVEVTPNYFLKTCTANDNPSQPLIMELQSYYNDGALSYEVLTEKLPAWIKLQEENVNGEIPAQASTLLQFELDFKQCAKCFEDKRKEERNELKTYSDRFLAQEVYSKQPSDEAEKKMIEEVSNRLIYTTSDLEREVILEDFIYIRIYAAEGTAAVVKSQFYGEVVPTIDMKLSIPVMGQMKKALALMLLKK